MTIDSLLAFRELDFIIDSYKDSIDFIKEKHPSRLDLIISLEQSIKNLRYIKDDIFLIESNKEYETWIK